RQVAVGIEEYRLDEQQVRIGHEIEQPGFVAFCPANVGDVTNFLARQELQHLALELAERECFLPRSITRAPSDANWTVLGLAGSRSLLEVGQPGTGGQAAAVQPALPHIYMCAFLEAEVEGLTVVVFQGDGANEKLIVCQQHAVFGARLGQILSAELVAATKARASDAAITAHFMGLDDEVHTV